MQLKEESTIEDKIKYLEELKKDIEDVEVISKFMQSSTNKEVNRVVDEYSKAMKKNLINSIINEDDENIEFYTKIIKSIDGYRKILVSISSSLLPLKEEKELVEKEIDGIDLEDNKGVLV